MALSEDVFRSILAMDAYNRDYNRGIDLSANSVGNATVQSFGLPSGYQSVSFFAQAYEWNGKTVISYRGTDELLLDAVSGYDLALGGVWDSQTRLAAEFYQNVRGTAGAGNIELVGHSLGGGLAGFISGLYGSEAVIFDNMPFEGAVEQFAEYIELGLMPAERAPFSNGSITADPRLDRNNIHGYYVAGEFLQLARSALGQTTPTTSIDSHGGVRSPLDLHSIALQTILLFAETETPSGNVTDDWKHIGYPFIDSLFDSSIADAIAENIEIPGGTNTNQEKMLSAIAYSAIDEGTRVFGDTGIRAMFNDADAFGKVLGNGDCSAILIQSKEAISDIFVQFAGQVALGKVLEAQSPTALEGVLELSNDEQTFALDFADSLWELGNSNGVTTNIVGRGEVAQKIFAKAGWSGPAEAPSELAPGMQWLWNDATANSIDRYVLPTEDSALAATLDDRLSESNKVSLFAAGGQDDQITGSSKADYIAGGDGNDTLKGADGDDLLAGGAGNDRLSGDEGKNFLAGGLGEDTVFYESSSPVNLTLTTIPDNTPATGAAPAGQAALELARDTGDIDRIIQVENVELTGSADSVTISQKPDPLSNNVLINGGSQSGQGDILDFSQSAAPVYLDNARGNLMSAAPNAVELYSNYSPILQMVQRIWNLERPIAEASGQGTYDGTGLRFTDFEQVIGSSQSDVLNLWKLSPGGGSNGQNVHVEGGAGNDTIVGSSTGTNTIYGGVGNDQLYAGGYVSTLYGGAGNDYLQGGGVQSLLYGGEGKDTFDLAPNSFAMDASSEDYAKWGSFNLTGGVQQWWMEDGWAYWSPFTSMMSAATPMSFLGPFGLLGMILDTATLGSFRYGLSESGQLIVQSARGRVGTAVIENYELDLDTAESTANVVAFKQVRGKGSLGELYKYIQLALKAGFGACLTGTDPLILDLDGDGVELTREAQGVYFDLDGDNFAEHTAWVKGGDGFLARDINGNGRVDDISELFGNADTSGFVHLKALDENNNNIIDASDAQFGTLRIWQDANGNGVTDAGELKTLDEVGIASISLSTTSPSTDSIRGNTIRAQATFTRTDGSTGTIMDVLLESSETDTVYKGDTTVSEAAAAQADLKGYGQVTDLAVAMTNDAGLLDMVAAFGALPASTSWDDLMASTQDILFRWTGADAVAPLAIGDGEFDQQKLAFLETYFGMQLTPRDANGNPSGRNLDELVESFDGVSAKTALRLAVQGPLAELFSGISYDAASDRLKADDAGSLANVYGAVLGVLDDSPETAKAQWDANWAPLLRELADNLVRADGVDVKTDYVVASLVAALDETASPLALGQLVDGLGLEGVVVGADGNDSLARGSDSGLKVYVGGAGNDTLTGGVGQDVYVFGRDFGQDTVIDVDSQENGDRLRLAVYNHGDVTFSLTIKDHFLQYHNIESFAFADGVTLTEAEVNQRAVRAQATTS